MQQISAAFRKCIETKKISRIRVDDADPDDRDSGTNRDDQSVLRAKSAKKIFWAIKSFCRRNRKKKTPRREIDVKLCTDQCFTPNCLISIVAIQKVGSYVIYDV